MCKMIKKEIVILRIHLFLIETERELVFNLIDTLAVFIQYLQ